VAARESRGQWRNGKCGKTMEKRLSDVNADHFSFTSHY